jgi:hypothetical protein
MPSLSLPLHSYRIRAAQASTARLVNCAIEQLPPDAKTPAVLVRSPGLASWGTVGTGPIEGMHTDHGQLYVVSGGGFYTVDSSASATFRGAVGSSTEIDMDSNDIGVVIVSPPAAYSYTLSGAAFAAISDSDFTNRGAGDVEFCRNFLLFREPDTGRIFGADLGSLTAFDALNFFTAEGSPDTALGLKVDHEQPIIFGEKSTEVWENVEISGFPFQRAANGFIELGTLNGKTPAKIDNSLFWVASDYTVRRLDGYTPVRVSTHAVEQWLKTVTAASLRGYSYTIDGHLIYLLTATEGAWQFDITTQLWHERSTYGSEPLWAWGNPVQFAGKVLVGSTTSNVIAELSPTTYADLGETQRMEWTYQPVYFEGKRVFHDSLELTCEVGVGLTTGQGSNPEVMLSASDDGGRTWFVLSNRSLGAIGKYATKVTWHGLGSAYQRVYRLAISDPVKVAIVDLILNYRVGR